MGAYIINVPSTVDRIIYVNVHPMDGKTYLASYSVDNLTPYTAPDLEQVRKEAWEAARTLWNTPKRKEIFGYTSFNTAIMTLTAQEVIEKIRAYEQAQKEIQVGDEVITASGKAVVMGVGPVHFEYVCADGSIGYDEVKNVKKTGRTFPEIAEVLRKMKESDNG